MSQQISILVCNCIRSVPGAAQSAAARTLRDAQKCNNAIFALSNAKINGILPPEAIQGCRCRINSKNPSFFFVCVCVGGSLMKIRPKSIIYVYIYIYIYIWQFLICLCYRNLIYKGYHGKVLYIIYTLYIHYIYILYILYILYIHYI